MNIVEPYAKLIDLPDRETGVRLLQKIEAFARISHRSEDAQTDVSWERFVAAVVLNHGDWSVVECVSVAVEMYVDRGVTHEVVRHRHFSFVQESTRFVNYQKKIGLNFISPFDVEDDYVNYCIWKSAMESAEYNYAALVNSGVPPQLARSVLPNSLASRLTVYGNLRNWRHFFLMRCSKETHPQLRQITEPLLLDFKSKIPLLFDDIEPNKTQRENLRLPR